MANDGETRRSQIIIGWVLGAIAFGIPSVLFAVWNAREADAIVYFPTVVNNTWVLGSRAGCAVGGYPPVPTWLFVYAMELFGMAVVATISAFFTDFPLIYTCVLLLHILFSFAWNVVGAVSLFRDSTCGTFARDLWNMVLAVLIMQWISFLSIYSEIKHLKEGM